MERFKQESVCHIVKGSKEVQKYKNRIKALGLGSGTASIVRETQYCSYTLKDDMCCSPSGKN